MHSCSNHRSNAAYSLQHSGNLSFFFDSTVPTEIYTLSLHDALPISRLELHHRGRQRRSLGLGSRLRRSLVRRSEEHTSELQSRGHLVCRLLLEKKKCMTHLCSPSGTITIEGVRGGLGCYVKNCSTSG